MDNSFLLTRKEVLERLYALWRPCPGTERVDIGEAAGRVAAEDCYALYDLPVVRASMMDGIAVDSSRFTPGIPDTKDWLAGIDYVRADTGDDFDDRFDAVIKIANTRFDNAGQLTLSPEVLVTHGAGVRGPGSGIKAGTLVVEKGRLLGPWDISLLAQGGHSRVAVKKRPRVAFIPTGNELIPPGATPARGKNFDTNSLLAAAMLREMGAEPFVLPIARDDPETLKTSLRQALTEADIVIVNGGSSKGAEDFNTNLLREAGYFICHGVSAVPGRPLAAAIIDGKPVINLPGPSLAAFFGLDWCVRSLVCHYLEIPVPGRRRVKAVLTEELRGPVAMDMLCRLQVVKAADHTYLATPLRRGPSIATVQTTSVISNAIFISPTGAGPYPAGSEIEVELCYGEETIPPQL